MKVRDVVRAMAERTGNAIPDTESCIGCVVLIALEAPDGGQYWRSAFTANLSDKNLADGLGWALENIGGENEAEIPAREHHSPLN